MGVVGIVGGFRVWNFGLWLVNRDMGGIMVENKWGFVGNVRLKLCGWNWGCYSPFLEKWQPLFSDNLPPLEQVV